MTDPPDEHPEAGAIEHEIDAPAVDEQPAVDRAIDAVGDVAPPPGHESSDAGWLRVVIVVWCFWLLGAWAMAWLSDTSVPRVRWMMFAGSFGLMLVWPAFRLSERVQLVGRGASSSSAALPVFMDWLAMVLVYQAVIWSLHLIAAWPLSRGLWLDAAVLSWSLLSALIVAATRRWPGAAARSAGMALCIALVFAEPVAIWLADLAGLGGWAMRVSPIQAFWELTEPPDGAGVGRWAQHVSVVGLIAVLGWAVLGLWSAGEWLTKGKLGVAPGTHQQ